MFEDKPKKRLEEMLERIEKIEQICESKKGISTALSDDTQAQPAIIMHLIVMQEQIAKLEKNAEYDILNKFSKESLKGLSAIRNIASYDYEGINFAIIENVIRQHLPDFKKNLQIVLKDLKNDKLLQNFNSNLKKLQTSSNLLPHIKETLQKELLKDFKRLQSNNIKLDDKTITFIKELAKQQGKSL